MQRKCRSYYQMVQKRKIMWKWHFVLIFNAVCQTEANGVFETVGGFMAEQS